MQAGRLRAYEVLIQHSAFSSKLYGRIRKNTIVALWPENNTLFLRSHRPPRFENSGSENTRLALKRISLMAACVV